MSKKLFVTSDHHFFHRNIIKYCNRPFDNEYHMNNSLIKRWNEVVSKNDDVIHLGDFTAGLKGRYKKAKEMFKKLNGNIFLVLGNHDQYSKETYIDFGFKFVGDYILKNKILFIHYPAIFNPKYAKPGNLLSQKLSKENDVKLILHGHTHSPNPDTEEWKKHFNVGVDSNNFKPIELKEILKIKNIV